MGALYQPTSFTGHVELHANPIRRTVHLIIWLFGHPSAWRSYIAEVAPDLGTNFCLLDLQRHHWRNPALRQILISAYLILPLIVALISFTWLTVTSQPPADIIRGVVVSYMYCLVTSLLMSLVHSVALGMGFSLALGLFSSIPDSMGGILYAVVLASGLGGQITVVTAPERPSRKPQAQLLAVSVGIFSILLMIVSGYTIVSGALTGAEGEAQIGEGMPLTSALAFGLGSGLIGGLVFATVTRIRVSRARTSVFVGLGVALLSTIGYAGSLSIPHTNLVIHVFGGTSGALLFSAMFLLPYSLVERAGGPWAGVISGAFACGMAWLPIYDFVVFENTQRNILMELPYGHFLIAAIIMAGLTMHYWMPVLIYPSYWLWNQFIYQRDRQMLPHKAPILKWNAVFWDEFQFLKLHGLDKHLVLVCEYFPSEGLKALHTINVSHQRWAAQNARVELDARLLERYDNVEAIATAHQTLATGTLLQGSANIILNNFSLISQDIQVALNHASTFHRRLGLTAVEERLNGLTRELARSSEDYAARFYTVAIRWLNILRAHLLVLGKSVEDAHEIDNPYIVGVPLTEQQKIFVGRSDIALRLEQWLSDQRCPPLFLYGQRRMGKTSLLLNLGRLIHGGILPLFVDGQYVASADNYREIMINTAREFNRSATRQRNVQLPLLAQADLSDNTVIKFNDWLDEIEQVLDRRGFTSALLALDEFDALYTAAKRGRFDETDFLNLLRYLVQHRPRFKVLLTSARTPDGFSDWVSQLINLQVMHLGPLRAEEARQLVEHPTQDFGLAYTPEASQRVIELSGGHPFLLQLLCYEIVTLKNSQPLAERHIARLADIEDSIAPALRGGQFFFEDAQRQGINEIGRSILTRIAAAGEGAAVPVPGFAAADSDSIAEQMQQIIKREILEEVAPGAYRFRIELVRRWFVQ